MDGWATWFWIETRQKTKEEAIREFWIEARYWAFSCEPEVCEHVVMFRGCRMALEQAVKGQEVYPDERIAEL